VKRKVRGNAWEVFVDSFGWIALGNRDDAYHEQAAALYRDLKQQGARMVTTDDVLVEVCKGLSRLRLRHFARQLIAQIETAKQQGALEVIHVTEDLFAEGLALFFVPPRQRVEFDRLHKFRGDGEARHPSSLHRRQTFRPSRI
jgi:predicted nucleic acid-binding protein